MADRFLLEAAPARAQQIDPLQGHFHPKGKPPSKFTLDVLEQAKASLLDGVPTGEEGWHAYFVHGYHLTPSSDDDLVAVTPYGGPVTSIVARDNLAGTQFHPEKSQKLGLALIANFLRWRP